MAEITLLMVSNPNSKPEYLAKTKIIENSDNTKVLPSRIVLDTYTRDAWAIGNPIDRTIWKTITLQSIDGKDKLKGFLRYLKERKKSMFGKLPSPSNKSKAMFVASHDYQPKFNDNIIVLKYVLDTNILKAKEPSKHKQLPGLQQDSSSIPTTTAKPSGSSRNGLLGNILGAQRRTANCLSIIPPSKKERLPTESNNDNIGSLTAQEVILQFRSKTESTLEDFNNNENETILKYPIVLSNVIKQVKEDEQDEVTEDILKYIIEELMEDIDANWISMKESSEFVDECVITIYKDEKYAPLDVLNELNQGDIPDEIQNQQRAKLVAQNKAKEKLLQKQLLLQQKNQLSTANEIVLNTNKRDRRTIEEIQRGELSDDHDDDDDNDVKRSRLD